MPAEAPAIEAPAQSGDGTNLPIGQNLNNAFSALDSIIGNQEEPEAAPDVKPDKKALAPQKPAEKPDKTPADKADKNGEKKDVPAQKPDEKPKPEKASSLREALDKAKAESKEWQRKHDEAVKAQSKPKDDPEKKQLGEKLAAAEKRIQELDEKLRYADFTEHDDYKNNYQKPYEKTYIGGREQFSKLKTVEVKDSDDQVIQASRPATAEEFDRMMAKDDEEAAEMIEKLFGTGSKASLVMTARHEIQKAWNAMQQARADFKAQGAERHKMLSEQEANTRKQEADLFKSSMLSGQEKYPKLFKAIEGDDRGNSMLEEGMLVAQLAFDVIDPADVSKLPQWIQAKLVNGELPRQEKINLHSAMLNLAGGANRLAYRNGLLEKEVAELKTRLEEYEESEPPKGEARRVEGARGGETLSADEMIDRMAAG